MPIVAQLIGGAGTGKTTELLRIMEGVVAKLLDPRLIGFVSFTKAARAEASSRAADLFNCKQVELEQDGWFKTLHAVCFKALGVRQGDLISDDKASQEWLSEALQDDVGGDGSREAGPYSEAFSGQSRDADKALALWGAARNRLEPLADAWRIADSCDPRTPPLPYCEATVDRYEQAKRLDGRLDFTDLLARFAGYNCTVEGAEKTTPDGDVPDLPVWFFDEQQDASALLDAVCHRLIAAPSCQWVYVVGDPFQSIYGWAGADPRYFLAWPHAKQRIMPKSYRCPAPILEFGERILRRCSDYWDRGIAPADREGTAARETYGSEFFDGLSPQDDWLLLARTNFQANRMARELDSRGVPWRSTTGRGGWEAPVRHEATRAMLAIECGAPINGGEWQSILKNIKTVAAGTKMLHRGTKKDFSSMTRDQAEQDYPWILPHELGDIGATPALMQAIKSKSWREFGWLPDVGKYATAVTRFGQEAVDASGLRIGTIHSVKGSEADNVAVLTTISGPCYQATATQRGKDEEHRVFYVGATRAKRKLVILDEPKPRYRKGLPDTEGGA